MDSEEDSLVTMVHHKSLLHLESDVIRLLTNCTYEVRWVILRLLYDALCFENPNCYKSCSEDLVGINPLMEPTIPTPECKFLNEKNYRLVAKIMNSDEVAEVILLMATSTECHSDCLAQVMVMACHIFPVSL